MTTVQDHVPATTAAAAPEQQAHDVYVLATRVVHEAETLLAAAEGFPEAVLHIEVAFAAALSVTQRSTWAEIRAAREHLATARARLGGAYWR